MAVLIAFVVGLNRPAPPKPTQLSNYTIALQSDFNRPNYYPLQQTVDSVYRSVAPWIGRLILPESSSRGEDWVWLEVYNAPPASKSLIGKTVRLEWSANPQVQADVQAVTRDVNLTPEAIESQRVGNVHPTRLNGRAQVGSLQSLAGARPEDDVIVSIDPVSIDPATASENSTQNSQPRNSQPSLKIAVAPVQIASRFYGLVDILASVSPESFRVRHYNAASQKFDGAEEIVRIPQVLAGRDGIAQSTPHQLAQSPAGKSGWYIYGAKNAEGRFVVQAIAPRSLFQLQPDQILADQPSGLNFINHQNWQQIQKASVRSILIDPTHAADRAVQDWQEGDRAILIHLFGGIGGNRAERQSVLGTVTGHFAYGLAEVVRDPFTQELRFDLRYDQVYSHNPHGIIAGKTSWANYMGSLQRGWLGVRPVADVLVKLDAVTQDYNFDGLSFSPLRELQRQLDLMMARYRIGDGTGAALVTPALSCVQDSSQAVYGTIKQVEAWVSSTPSIQEWLQSHPDHPQTQRFHTLVELAKDLDKELIPVGIVRSDWRQNAQVEGIRRSDFVRQNFVRQNFVRQNNLFAQLLSWRTAIPRIAHDQVISIFLQHGATLWLLRTNQVGGWNPEIMPLAPTELLGQFFVIPNAFSRLIESVSTPLTVQGWLFCIAMLLLYGSIALPLGFQQGFLRWNRSAFTQPLRFIPFALQLAIAPALLEEVIFRVLLIPHPSEAVDAPTNWVWAIFSLILFVLYHPLNARLFYPAGNPTFWSPIFLVLTGLLGGICTIVYVQTGSLGAIVLIHWVVVLVWLGGLGGEERLTRSAE